MNKETDRKESFGAQQPLYPHPHSFFSLGIKGLAVQSPVAQQMQLSQGRWIYARALWPGEYDYLIWEKD